MSVLQEVVTWFGEAATWSGSNGIPTRVKEHLMLSGTALLFAAPVAIAVGLFIGHTRKAEFISVTIANLGRAIPSFAILAFVFPFTLRLGLGLGFWPTVIALFFLAIPPILTNTYVGVKGVDQDAVEAARGMGMSGAQILRMIEIPLAARLIVSGLRTSSVQVVATATLGAVIASGGLGRYIVDGFAFGTFGPGGVEGRQMVVGGALLVAALALITEIGLGFLERHMVPRGVSGRKTRMVPGPEEAIGVPAGGAI
jgi:osmoprotectant transport system permease protein